MQDDRRPQQEGEGSEEEFELLDNQREALMARLLQTIFFPRQGNNQTNEDLVASLKRSRAFTSDKVEESLLAIPRQYFVTEGLLPDAYVDNPLRFSRMGFNISAPHMHAMCLENMNIEPGDIILDIGSGSGLLTAYCAYLTGPTGHVYGVDLHDHIIEFSLNNMKKLAEAKDLTFDNITFIKRNCFLPVANPILYDRIHVGCCCPETKLQFLFDLLKPGGILLTPYGDELIRAEKDVNGKITTKPLVAVRYSDLTLPSDAEVKEAEREIKRARANSILVPTETIPEQFGRLFCNSYLSDVVIHAGGDFIPAHSLILNMYSKYFTELLASGKQENEKRHVYISDLDPLRFKSVLRFMYHGSWPKDMTANALQESTSLAVKLGVLSSVDDTTSTLLSRLNSLVASKDFSDITFKVDGNGIPAHKLILRIRSEYFNGMLSSGLRESRDSVIDIHDCTAEIFTEVLRYIYTGDCRIQDENCIGILEQANLLRLDRLTTICEQFWFKNITNENAATILQVSDHYNAYQLKQFAMEYIFKHVKDVVATQAWRELDIDLVSMVLVAAVERGK